MGKFAEGLCLFDECTELRRPDSNYCPAHRAVLCGAYDRGPARSQSPSFLRRVLTRLSRRAGERAIAATARRANLEIWLLDPAYARGIALPEPEPVQPGDLAALGPTARAALGLP